MVKRPFFSKSLGKRFEIRLQIYKLFVTYANTHRHLAVYIIFLGNFLIDIMK